MNYFLEVVLDEKNSRPVVSPCLRRSLNDSGHQGEVESAMKQMVSDVSTVGNL